MPFKKVAERYPLWNPHYKGDNKEHAGKSGDYLRGWILKVRAEGLPENVGLLVDVRIIGKAYEKVVPGASLKGKDVRLQPDFKNSEVVTWILSDKYVNLISELTGKEGEFIKVLYGGPVKSKYDKPAADWQVEVSEGANGNA